ncbi:MAG: RnfABCDGE type electron transport complex subunit D [Fusobacteria bacterium]|nr:RnfABCDGE type electron transport complex subunit D [Fusobacteriota bacterium]
MLKKLRVSSSPHIRSNETVTTIMRDVLIALVPSMVMAIVFFRVQAVILLLTCMAASLIIEWGVHITFKRKIDFTDTSPLVTGILLALIVPSNLPLWMAIIGVFVAIFFGKMVFGGLGHNIFNPALVGRCFLLASWPVAMTNWASFDGVSGATVLNTIKMHGNSAATALFGTTSGEYLHMFLGSRLGSLGETSTLALLIGALYLFLRRTISWHTPASMIGTVFLLSWCVGRDPILSIMSGGLILGAFFMATDMVTTPKTGMGKIIFGVGAGALVVWIRVKGGYPEGVAYAILLMNAVTPLIDKMTKPKPFGYGGKNA